MNRISERLIALSVLAGLALAPQLTVSSAGAMQTGAAANAECRRTLPSYPTLNPGDRGRAVRTLQCALNDLDGPEVVVDGVYGPQTRRAISEIEARFEGGPVHPGRITSAYWGMLYGCQLPERVLKQGDRGHAVLVLQRSLRGYGGDITVDGRFGVETKRVLKHYQRQLGHTETGRLDSDTQYLICWGAFG